METPIADFIKRYAQRAPIRLHMPGHKGTNITGAEPFDITEIDGADSLYEASGIIEESEKNASRLFGSQTFYSTEGSSHCIRAMLYLAMLHAPKKGTRPLVAAGRNVHKTFLSAAAFLDFDILWLYPEPSESYLSCSPSPEKLDRLFAEAPEKPCALYLTSPDYIGGISDIHAIAKICRKHDILLLVDNAHGAYLRFLPESRHPIDLGADLCCDSAHKTLPVLTGGAYLHVADHAPKITADQVKRALALFGSTSPSYLILQSLDLANRYLEGATDRFSNFLSTMQPLKESLKSAGYALHGDEPFKITICARSYGYTGIELSAILKEHDIVCEFADPDFLVLMFTPEISANDMEKIRKVLVNLPKKEAIASHAPVFSPPLRVLTPREAIFAESERIPVQKSLGRISASSAIGCPPAVPIVICGERIDETVIRLFSYYGIQTCDVVKSLSVPS